MDDDNDGVDNGDDDDKKVDCINGVDNGRGIDPRCLSLPMFILLFYHLIYPFLQDVLSESSLNSTIAHSALPSSVEHCRRYNHKYNSYQASGTKQLHRSSSSSSSKKKIIFQQYDVDNFSLPYYHAYIEHFHDSYDVCRYDTNDDDDHNDSDDVDDHNDSDDVDDHDE